MLKILKDNKGFTLVEMVMAFAVLTIFMAAIATTLAPISKQYTKMQQINHVQNIQDGILEQVRSYLMQADMESDGGYIKLRSVDSSHVPNTVKIGMDDSGNLTSGTDFHDHTGSVLEFKINGFCAMMDTRGYKGYKSKNPNASDVVRCTDYFNYSSGYLSIRYFLQATDKTFYDKIVKSDVGSIVYSNENDADKFTSDEYESLLASGTVGSADYKASQMGDDLADWTAYGAYQCFDKNFYMGYRTKVTFTIPSEAIHRDSETNEVYVSYILATCRVSDESLTDSSKYSADTLPIYFKEPMRYENSRTSLKYDPVTTS
jgi:prepilin-type N-terminal cleavage/methylation domain-containing protein